MDIVFLLGIALLWGLTALPVKGLERLNQPTRGQA
jgi:hypothetical protein